MTATALKDAPPTGTIAYNGFEFGGDASTPPAYNLRGEPVYDEAGRTVTQVRYTLEVSTIIYAESENDTAEQMQNLRRRLTRPGRKLELLDIGLGDTTIERGASHPDYLWGARPAVLELTPVGGVLAWQLVWRCEFNVGEREGASDPGRNWLAFNFAATYTVDHRGLTVRHIVGHVLLPQIRQPAGAPRGGAPADRHRDRVRIAVPPNFRRKSAKWHEPPDRTRLEFNVIDEELGGDALPPGIVAGELEFKLENKAAGSAHARATLRGWLEAAPGAARLLPLRRLLTIAQAKLESLRRTGRGTCLVLPGKVAVTQQLFTRRTAIELELIAIGSIFDLLRTSGIWQAVPGFDDARWRASVGHLWNNRGHAGLAANESEAAILDLTDNPASRAAIGRDGGTRTRPASEPDLPRLTFRVTPERSWLEYEIRLRVERRENVSLHALACGVRYGTPAPGGVGLPYRSTLSPPTQIREVHGEPRQQVVIEGRAVRLVHPPTTPVLMSLGGRPLLERDRSEQREHIGTYAGLAATALTWSIRYDVCGYLANLEPPPSKNPG